MKTQSNNRLPLVMDELRTNLYNFNETERTITPETGEPYTMWEYDSFRVDKPVTYDTLVVAMIRDKYSANDEAKIARWTMETAVLKTKTLTEDEMAEVTAYSNYVAWCHEQARLATL